MADDNLTAQAAKIRLRNSRLFDIRIAMILGQHTLTGWCEHNELPTIGRRLLNFGLAWADGLESIEPIHDFVRRSFASGHNGLFLHLSRSRAEIESVFALLYGQLSAVIHDVAILVRSEWPLTHVLVSFDSLSE